MKDGAHAGDPAAILCAARQSGAALAAFPGPVPDTLEDAYACQRRLLAGLGSPVRGWKVGRIPPAMTGVLAAERLAGPVLRCAMLSGEAPGEAAVFVGGAAAIEVEVMLRLAGVPDRVLRDDAEARGYVDAVCAGFEVASSPAPDVHDHAPFGIISDNGINNGILIGPSLSADDFDHVPVETRIGGTLVGQGRAVDILDGPLGALRFLVDLHLRGMIVLAPGQWISAGAITGVHPFAPGEVATARFGADLAISCVAVPETGYSS
ncbi:MAG: 2-keto-4-pentenoate hydratase [Sphingopyxis sp.]|uniref:2-keto-4-pentenoate hydratase n=1 Tax=Sphingopyxis sp. TaxID=1908224 RepID=UPI002ABB9ADC|nr:2-keto-4-pentenoate hydratase [Sphingopyxis sp.]MDZ3832712.1 2-keto-4-pentenoate hydratase [Sphingopyxis sp.]